MKGTLAGRRWRVPGSTSELAVVDDNTQLGGTVVKGAGLGGTRASCADHHAQSSVKRSARVKLAPKLILAVGNGCGRDEGGGWGGR
ncbi:hypothetical protein Q7C36_007782 [Tachysurus vachellii]|uniref:Uncharacterized protein n=1 Tax=Tachysurus vachellii TaxID=175792 RepID=A0AA88N9B9_TACVA|nr:hypothetical protein Q7C36_007782 [Tachysurus vachellii]